MTQQERLEALAARLSVDVKDLRGRTSDTSLADIIESEISEANAAVKYVVGAAFGLLFVRNFLTPGATAAENFSAISFAVDAAATEGLTACFDGVDVSINDEIVLDAPGQRIWSSFPESCRLLQTGALNGKGVFRIAADDVTIDGFTLSGDVPMSGETLDLTGLPGDAHHASAIKVDMGVARPTIRRIKGDRWFILLVGFPYAIGQETSAAPETYEYITGLRVEDIEVSEVWAAVRMSGLDDADYANVRGSYVVATGHVQANTAPPHLFYISMPTISAETPKAYNRNVRVRNCHARDGRGGSPFSLRYTHGMTISGLTADNSEGLLDMIGVKGFTSDGGHSTRDRYPKVNGWNGDRGSMSFLYCSDGQVGPFLIEGATDFNHGSLFYIASSENVTLTRPAGWVDLLNADGGLRAAYISGRNIRVIRPEVESRGADVAIGYFLGEGFAGDSTPIIDEPVTRGNFLRDFDLTATTTKARINYDPTRLAGRNQSILTPDAVTLAGFPVLNNTRYGYPPEDEDARTIAWLHGERLSNNAVLRSRWPSGHVPNVVTDAWVSTPPYISANSTVTGLWCADVGTANVEVECNVKHGAGSVGLAFRAVDTNNFLQVVLTATNLVFAKRVAGTYTTLVTVPLPESGSGVWHNIRVRAIGARITVYLDDDLAITHTLAGSDATTFTTPTSHGLRSDNGGASSAWYGLRIRQA